MSHRSNFKRQNECKTHAQKMSQKYSGNITKDPLEHSYSTARFVSNLKQSATGKGKFIMAVTRLKYDPAISKSLRKVGHSPRSAYTQSKV